MIDKIEVLKRMEASEQRLNEIYAVKVKEIDDGFTMNIFSWMVELELKPYELFTYALIYQFSQPGSKSCYTGSIKYLENSLNCDHKTAENSIKSLVARGLVDKQSVYYNNGVKHNRYAVILPKMPPVKGYITLQGWMLKMDLKPSEILVYAKIYNHSMPGSFSAYSYNMKDLCTVTGLNERTVARVMQNLLDMRRISLYKSNEKRKKAYVANYPKAAVVVYNEKNKNREDFEPISINA